MRIDPANKFQQFVMDEHELKTALAVNPYTYAYLHNKIAEKAHMVIEHQFEEDSNATHHIIEHEKLKAQLNALEDLMSELTPPVSQPAEDSAT